MKKAINAWTIPGNVSLEDMFQDIAQAGFDAIELNIDGENFSNHSLTMDSDAKLYDRINGLARYHKLPVHRISTSLYGGTLGSNDPDEREFGKAVLRKQLECARALGADAILAVPGGISDSVSIRTAAENSRPSLETLLPAIARARIAVGVENVWNGFFASPSDMTAFKDGFSCKYVRAYFDVGNVAAFSYPEYWIDMLGGRICNIHVKDYLRTLGWHSGCWVNLLEGSIRWNKVTAALRHAGYDGALTAELPAMPATPKYLYGITSAALDEIIAY